MDSRWIGSISILCMRSVAQNTKKYSNILCHTWHDFDYKIIFLPQNEFTISLFSLWSKISKWTDSDLALLSGASLLSPQRHLLTNHSTIVLTHSQNQILDSLNKSDLSPILSDLRRIGTAHGEILDWFRQHWNKLVCVPPLFAEIFDIPRSIEDENMYNSS